MLRERYEQMREQALVRVGMGSAILMRQGMRSWMEAGGQEDSAEVLTPPPEGRLRPDMDFQQVVAVWAGVLVGQAERSYSGQRKA